MKVFIVKANSNDRLCGAFTSFAQVTEALTIDLDEIDEYSVSEFEENEIVDSDPLWQSARHFISAKLNNLIQS